MEVWLGQMRPVGSDVEVLGAQVREQKVTYLASPTYIHIYSISYIQFEN
jgi:hypothetical protein